MSPEYWAPQTPEGEPEEEVVIEVEKVENVIVVEVRLSNLQMVRKWKMK